ncbi:MAG: S8 family serine peptidase, partial [Planctomycetota bacterium]
MLHPHPSRFVLRTASVFAVAATLLPVSLAQEGEGPIAIDLDETQRSSWAQTLEILRLEGADVKRALPDTPQVRWLHQNAIDVLGGADVEDPAGGYYLEWRGAPGMTVAQLAELPGVETARALGRTVPAAQTSSYAAQQTYFWNPSLWLDPTTTSIGGIGLLEVRAAQGPMPGSNVRVAVLELGFGVPPWESQWHADLDPANLTVLLPQPSATYAGFATASDIDHGTATSTILFGRQENADPTLGPGVTGAVPYATGFLVPIVSSAGSDIPGALLAAQAQLGAGDVVQMALQTMFMGAYRPVTVDPNVAMTVAMLDAAGIHVVHAAGNSGVDVTEFTQPSGLGHAVGAFDWTTGHAEPFSNQSKDIIFGAQGSNVVAGGYGDLCSGSCPPHLEYTAVYSGTSAASSIVAGAIAAVVDAHRTTYAVGTTPDTSPYGVNIPGWPTDPETLRAMFRSFVPGGVAFQQYIGGAIDAALIARNWSVAPHGFGADLALPQPPVLLNRVVNATGGPPVYDAARVGEVFDLTMTGFPVFSSYTGDLWVSLTPTFQSIPGFPGATLLSEATSIPVDFGRANIGILGCGQPITCGQITMSVLIPGDPAIVGAAFWAQARLNDSAPVPGVPAGLTAV